MPEYEGPHLRIGIAGSTLADRLPGHGVESTLVEHAPRLRPGGYAVDFWGLGYDIAERTAIISDVRRGGYQIKEIRIVNARKPNEPLQPPNEFSPKNPRLERLNRSNRLFSRR